MPDETTEVAHYAPPERVRVLRFAGDDTRHRIRRGRLTKSNGNGAIYSRSVEESDPFLGQYNRNNLIVAPYAFINLYKIFEKSDALQGNVAAYIQNIDGFGYKLNFLGDDYTQKDTDQAKADFTTLSNFFDWPNDEESFMSIRKKCRMDYEVTGNAAIEVIRNLAGEIQMLHYMPIRSVRMSKLDSEMTTYNVDLMRKGIKRSIPRQKRFRRYAQIPQGKRAPIWFKEFGDPRPLDYRTGEYKQRTKYMATELLWFKQHFAGYPYGLPRWIGATLEVLGRTSAQFVNYDLFKNQGIPPMIITVSNGVLTEESLLELEDMVDGWRGEENFNRAGLLEAVPESTGMDDKGNAKIDIKMLTEQRKEDAMFKNYLEHSEVAIRKCFRLPPLYVGGTEEFNKACVSMDTETLTENGWKFYHEIDPKERIATIHPETHELEYHVPHKRFRYEMNNEDMIYFRSRSTDLFVTPEHDIWFAYNNDKKREWRKQPAEDFLAEKARDFLFMVAPTSYVGKENGHRLEIPRKEYPGNLPYLEAKHNAHPDLPLDLFLEFMSYIIADGRVDKKPCRIAVSAKKERKLALFDSCFRELTDIMQIPLNIGPDRDRTCYIMRDPCLHAWLTENIGNDAYIKRLPDFVLHLPASYREIVLEGLLATDGWVNGPNSWGYSSASKELADQIQILAFSLGYRAIRADREDPRPNRVTRHEVSITKKNTHLFHRYNIEKQKYTGEVYCFDVPNHLFVTRRRGIITISGNTAVASIMVAEQQVFAPERNTFDEKINVALVQKEFGIKDWAYRTKGPQVVGSDEITKGVANFAKVGAISINYAIDMANRAFGLEMSRYPYKWADLPLFMVQEMIKAGVVLTGLDGTAEVSENAKKAILGINTEQQVTKALPPGQEEALQKPPVAKWEQTVFPHIQEAKKQDLFSEEERELYRRLLIIDDSVKRSLLGDEITDEHYEL